jgi:hypothetical protein
MSNTATRSQRVSPAINTFGELIGPYTVSGSIDEVQPPISLILHLVQMRTAGWKLDIHDVAALSGVSALTIYQHDTAGGKDAHTLIEPERRLAQFTGFGYEWLTFADVEDAWRIVRRSVNAGRAVRTRHEEDLLLAGYEEGPNPTSRRVCALIDDETASTWWSWEQFGTWVERMVSDGMSSLGRYTTHTIAQSPAIAARHVLNDLVAWSVAPPDVVHQRHPDAAYGLQAISTYADAMPNRDVPPQEGACCDGHAIHRQWSLRRCTAVYLGRVADWALWPEAVNDRLREAAAAYQACHEAWRRFHAASGSDHGAIVEDWLRHESTAVSILADLVKAQGW